MSQENVEVIRAGYAAWAKRDLDSWLETLHPEVEFQTSGSFPDLAPIYRGHRGMRSFWDAMLVPWGSFHLDVERIVKATSAPPLPSDSVHKGKAAVCSPICGRVMPCASKAGES